VRASRPWLAAVRILVVGALAAVALLVTTHARASSVVSIGSSTGFSFSGASYGTAKSTIGGAISAGNALGIPLSIPDLQQIDASNVSYQSDDAHFSMSVQGDVTIKGVGTQLQLSAVWDSASSTTPHVALAVKPTASDLQSINSLWASAPVNPTLTDAMLLLSPSGFAFDPAKLPSAAQAFYPKLDTLTMGSGVTLLANVNLATDPNLANALHYLGEGTNATVEGTLAGSAGVLFGGTSAQLAGLDMKITISGGASLPSWITARTSSVEFKLTGGGGSYTPSVAFADDITTNLNGAVNEFTGGATYNPNDFGGVTVGFTYGLAAGTTLQPPFNLGALTLASPKLALSMSTGIPRTFSGSLETDATVNATTVHLKAAITVAGGGTVTATLSATGSVTPTDAVSMANTLLGTSLPTASLGTDITLNEITFSFTKDGVNKSFELDAKATVRSLSADVLISLRKEGTAAPTLVVGLRLTDAGSTCNCITPGKLFGGTISDLVGDLQLPAVNLFTSFGFGTTSSASVDVPTISLSSIEKGFFQKVWSTLPANIKFGPNVTIAATLALPDAVINTFGMAPGSSVVLNGDVGFGLSDFGAGAAPGLGANLTATLPAMTAGLPSWISNTGTWTLNFGVASGVIQLGASGTLTATVQNTAYPIDISGRVSKIAGVVGIHLAGTVHHTFTNVFGLSWLGVTDPSVSLDLSHGGGSTSFGAKLEADIALGPGSAHVAAEISKSDGTEASLTVTTTSALSTTDVASFFGLDLSGVSGMPTATLDSLTAKLSATAAATSFDMVANTTVTLGSKSFSSSLLISLGKDKSANHVVVGFRPTSTVKLSDLVSSVPSGVDFSFPTLAVVLAHPKTTMTFADVLPDEKTFFDPFCGATGSPCNTSIELKDGVSIVAAVAMPSALSGIVDALHVDPTAPALVVGTLPIFGSIKELSLSVTLPGIPVTDTTPDPFQGGQLSLVITPTSLSLTGSMIFNIPKGHIATKVTCNNLGGVWRVPRGTTQAESCFDQVPFDVSTAITLTPVPSVTLTGGLHSGYVWHAPMDTEWLSINTATIEFGVTIEGQPVFTLGFAIGATVANHDFLGAFKIGIETLEPPPFIVLNPMGFRITSNSGVSMQDLVTLASAVSGKTLSLGSAPNIALRNLDLRWSEVTDTALCLPQGFHLAADLYINPTAAAVSTPASAGCPDSAAEESNRTTTCLADASNGCFASVDIGVDDAGIHGSGNLGAFGVGPLNFGGALVDMELTKDVQRLLIKGGMSITGFASGSVDLLISTTELHFRGSVDIFGSAFKAFLDGTASFNLAHLTDLKNPPSFTIKAVLKSDFLSQAGVAMAGTLQELKPVIQAIDVILGDLSNGDLLSAIIDLPQQAASLGATLPAPYGDALSLVATKLNDIRDSIKAFEHTVSWGINELLNGFDLSFPGIPGTVQPPEATCITTFVNGHCYFTPPFCVDGFGCSPGTDGTVLYPTCITTWVDGTCYSIPPVSGLHIPGLCEALKPLIPGLTSCDITKLSDTLFMPALRALFKTVTGYDIGPLSLSNVLTSVSNALGSGNIFSIDCAEFDAHVGATNGSPSAGVSLATSLNLFGSNYQFGVGWDFSAASVSGNAGKAVLDVIKSIITPNTAVSCGLPSDWNTNASFPAVVGTAPTNSKFTTAPVTPTMALAPGAATVDEGSLASVSGTIAPAPASPQTVTITWGDGATSTATTSGDSFTATHTYGNNTPIGQAAGQFSVHAAVSGGPSASTVITVRNVAPSNLVLTPSSATINEGSSVTVGGSFTDPGSADTHSVAITWGDGGSDTMSLAAGVTTFTTPAHTYVDNNGVLAGYPVKVTVGDDDNASTVTSTSIGVNNVAPKTIVITPSPASTPEKQLVTFGVTFVDPGALDTQTAVVDWGDGSVQETLSLGTLRAFSISHQWSEADTAAHPDGKFPVSLTLTDKDGGVGTATVTETVTNVAPSNVSATLAAPTIDEFKTATVWGGFADASGNDAHTVTVDWGVGWGPAERYTIIQLLPGVFSYSASRQYGDSGAFTVGVSVADDDGASAATSTVLTVNNVAPTAVINRSATVPVQGNQTFLGHALHPLTFSERSVDPGSDDLTMTWNWADGTKTATTYLVNPPNPDPVPSPQVSPRDVIDTQTHTWQAPCVYSMGLTTADGDGGIAKDANVVVITGNATRAMSAEDWYQQFNGRADRKRQLSPATLACYLKIVDYMSGVLGQVTPAQTSADALRLLRQGDDNESNLARHLDRDLLVAWLNFANGVYDWNTMVDTDGDHRADDIAFSVLMYGAERVRLNPLATRRMLHNQIDLLEEVAAN
jgi:hypothetical protein